MKKINDEEWPRFQQLQWAGSSSQAQVISLTLWILSVALDNFEISDDETNPAFYNGGPLEAKQVVGQRSKCWTQVAPTCLQHHPPRKYELQLEIGDNELGKGSITWVMEIVR